MNRLVLSLAVLMALSGSGRAADIGWPEAIERLAHARNEAEECLRFIKSTHERDLLLPARRDYVRARAKYNAVIEGLTIVLAQRGKPETLPRLKSDLKDGNDSVVSLCRTANSVQGAVVPKFPTLAEIAAKLALPVFHEVVDAITKYIGNDMARQEILKGLQAAKWRDFDDIPASLQPW